MRLYYKFDEKYTKRNLFNNFGKCSRVGLWNNISRGGVNIAAKDREFSPGFAVWGNRGRIWFRTQSVFDLKMEIIIIYFSWRRITRVFNPGLFLVCTSIVFQLVPVLSFHYLWFNTSFHFFLRISFKV